MLLLNFEFSRLLGLGGCLCTGFVESWGLFGAVVNRVVDRVERVGICGNFRGIEEGVVGLYCDFLMDLFGYFGCVNFVT